MSPMKCDMRDREFRAALNERIRRRVREELFSKEDSARSTTPLLLLRVAAAVLSLILAGGAATLNQEASSLEKKPANQPSAEAGAADIENASPETRLRLAEIFRTMVLNSEPLPGPTVTLVSRYVETREQEAAPVSERLPSVIVNNQIPPSFSSEELTALTKEIAALAAKSGTTVIREIDKESTQAVEREVNSLTIAATSVEKAATTLKDLSKTPCCQPTPEKTTPENVTNVVEYNSPVAPAKTPDRPPEPAPNSRPALAPQQIIEIPEGNESTACTRIASVDEKAVLYLRFAWEKPDHKAVSIVDCSGSAAPRFSWNTRIKVGQSIPALPWFLFTLTAEEKRLDVPVLHRIPMPKHYFVQVFPLETH